MGDECKKNYTKMAFKKNTNCNLQCHDQEGVVLNDWQRMEQQAIAYYHELYNGN